MSFYRYDKSREQWEKEERAYRSRGPMVDRLQIAVKQTDRVVTLSQRRESDDVKLATRPSLRKIKRNKFPFLDCYEEAQRLKRHVQLRHVPAIFHDQETSEQLTA